MKKLLFIGPRFYNYHEIIKQGFERAGYEVDYFDDRPDTNFITKALIRLNKNLIKRKIRKYFDNIKANVSSTKYDVIFVLYGQSFSKEMIEELKTESPSSRFVFYMYDPISSMPDRIEFAQVFDDCYSFDYDDCRTYDNFKLIPLFYSFENYPVEEIKYDACVLLTMMPGKYEFIKAMVNGLENNGLNVYKKYILQSKLVWLYYKLTNKEFRHSKSKEFFYKRLPKEDVNRVLMQSKFILDCPKKGQTGLTIRTFEALAANKKLITTNKTIVNYDFYRPENIYVFDGEFDFDDIFFHSEYIPVDDRIKENYSIDSWVRHILQNCN
ncbi:MAG: hypothetical protein ACI4WG_03100 [Erysipelotrichaceae bacterium]